MKTEVIYCLAEIGGDPFYVGRSEDWHRRWKEHIWAAKSGHETKYQHIRKLWAAGKDFELIVLDEKPKLRYEKYYHYILGCEYDLTNQKMGDSWRVEQAALKGIRETGVQYSSPDQYLSVLDAEIDRVKKEEKARKETARTQVKIRSEFVDVERTIFVGEDPNKKFLSPAVRAFYERRRK